MYGARVSASGVVLDPDGIPIVDAIGSQVEPSLAWGSSSYLVAWGDSRGQAGVSAARVDADGAVLDPGGFVVTEMAINDGWPSVSWNGVNFLVVLEADLQRQTSNVLGVRVLPFGIVLDDPAYPIAASSGWEYDVTSVRGTGTSSVVAYTRWPTGASYVERPFLRFVDHDPQPAPTQGDYTVSTETGQALVHGTVDIGNHCDDCVTTIDLPFPVRFYGRSYTSLNASSNGVAQFLTDSYEWSNVCPLPGLGLGRSISLLWDDLVTDQPARGSSRQ